jgi:hypothetical protein
VYVLGCPVAELYDLAEPSDRPALGFRAVSAGGNMHVGLCPDPDSLGGLDVLAIGLEQAFDDLRRRC